MARGYQLIKVTCDLGTLPPTGGKKVLLTAGQPITAVFLNSAIPAGVTFRLLYGDNAFGLIFGTGFRLDHTNICPPIWDGINATWDVAAPGTTVELLLEVQGGGGTTA